MLEQDIPKKAQVDKMTSRLKLKNNSNSKEYKGKAIWDSTVYEKESKGHLPGLYYFISWKSYPEEKNIKEPTLAILHLRKLISKFYREHP